MTEPTARDRLDDMLAQEWPTTEWVIEQLPLVLEAAREAGKAEHVMAAHNGIWLMWHLIGDEWNGDAT